MSDSRPRAVRLTHAGKALVVLAFLLLQSAAVAAVLLISSAQQGRERNRQIRHGATAQAEIIKRWRASGGGDRHFVIYQFSAAGKLHQRQARIAGRTWRKLDVGSLVHVRYAPARLDWSRLADIERMGGLPSWVGFVIPACLAGAACLSLYSVMRQRRLLAVGRAAWR